MRSHSLFIATTIFTLVASGCTTIQPTADMTAVSTATPAPAADHGGHGSMVMEADVPFDAMFIDSMIEHHQGAIDMAEAVLEQAEREEVRTLATAIIAAQTTEIEQMRNWRSEWYPDLASTSGMGMDMGEMMMSDDASLPLEQRFITAMISHHEGAIDMAKMALDQAEHDEIRTLAAAIIAAQETEIEQMRSWLKDWFDDGATSSINASPYATQLTTPVRGLTAEEVDDLLNGRGMGFARMAELNSYPGPRHLLDLQVELALTPEQIVQIEQAFQSMAADAQALGREIVREEQALSDAFAAGTLDSIALKTQVRLLGDYYGQLRNIHLQAHLQVTPLLTAEQVAHYNGLRGYTDAVHGVHSH